MVSRATEILIEISTGETSDTDRLMENVYADFRSLAKVYLKGDKGTVLQPTALVHEAFLKLIDTDRIDWKGRSHFFAVGAVAMRQILVDHARKRATLKSGGSYTRVAFNEDIAISPTRDTDVLALDEALEKLATIDARRAKIVEMRFFAAMTEEEIAVALGVSKSTVEKHWASSSCWLRRELSGTRE